MPFHGNALAESLALASTHLQGKSLFRSGKLPLNHFGIDFQMRRYTSQQTGAKCDRSPHAHRPGLEGLGINRPEPTGFRPVESATTVVVESPP